MILFQADNHYSWFQVKQPLVSTFLDELGYPDQTVTRHEQLYLEAVDYGGALPQRVETGGIAVAHYTVTARRSAVDSR